MLALSRKKGEALVISNNIEVTILEIKGDQVKIGISAPREVPVYRKEIYLQIQDSNKAATDVSGMQAQGSLGLTKTSSGRSLRPPCFLDICLFYR